MIQIGGIRVSTKTKPTVRAVLFDFDGTLSTLRAGWEDIMAPFMKESILGPHTLSEEEEKKLEAEIDAYIHQSAGIQTVLQMEWLAGQVRSKGWNLSGWNAWDFKAEYNRRLLEQVNERIRKLEQGELSADHYLMKGAIPFLFELQNRQIEMYVASGTDHPDVLHEAEVLGVRHFFKDIAGAPVGRADCSKEKVIRDLLEVKEYKAGELAVIGDGKVEIRLGKEKDALTIGLASDEIKREGIDPIKEERLLKAGADYITGDYLDLNQWSMWLRW
jgi:phosphoglycolate phosphatase-like HAD superfamily hydrolase